jgi:hypothetical protein
MRHWLKKKIDQYRTGTIAYTDPLTAGRHPFQIYLLSLACFSGFIQLIGAAPPDTLTRNLEPALVSIWSWMLVLGSSGALLGLFWPQSAYATGLTIERIGLVATGVAAVIYGGFIIFALGIAGMVAGSITAAFGLACCIRARHIGKIFHRALDPNPPEVEKEEGR